MKKLRMTITLDEADAELFLRAVDLAEPSRQNPDSHRRRWVLSWFIRAASAVVLRNGGMVCPLAFEQRIENIEETEERIGQKLPAPAQNIVVLGREALL